MPNLNAELTVEEQENIIKTTKVAENAVVLANITELATSIVIKIAGKDVADTLNNQSLNRNVLSGLIANRIKEKVLA